MRALVSFAVRRVLGYDAITAAGATAAIIAFSLLVMATLAHATEAGYFGVPLSWLIAGATCAASALSYLCVRLYYVL